MYFPIKTETKHTIKENRASMKLQLFIFLLLLYSGVVIGQQKQHLSKQLISEKRYESTRTINVDQPKTIQHKAFDKYSSDSFLGNRFPCIYALPISILFLSVNILTIMRLRQTYKKYLQHQDENNDRNLQYQIDRSIEIQQQYLRTIISAKKISKISKSP